MALVQPVAVVEALVVLAVLRWWGRGGEDQCGGGGATPGESLVELVAVLRTGWRRSSRRWSRCSPWRWWSRWGSGSVRSAGAVTGRGLVVEALVAGPVAVLRQRLDGAAGGGGAGGLVALAGRAYCVKEWALVAGRWRRFCASASTVRAVAVAVVLISWYWVPAGVPFGNGNAASAPDYPTASGPGW